MTFYVQHWSYTSRATTHETFARNFCQSIANQGKEKREKSDKNLVTT